MMKKFFKNLLLKKLASRTLTLKFYYPSPETASKVFNALSNFFTLNKDKYQILKSGMNDDYWDARMIADYKDVMVVDSREELLIKARLEGVV